MWARQMILTSTNEIEIECNNIICSSHNPTIFYYILSWILFCEFTGGNKKCWLDCAHGSCICRRGRTDHDFLLYIFMKFVATVTYSIQFQFNYYHNDTAMKRSWYISIATSQKDPQTMESCFQLTITIAVPLLLFC